MLVKIKKYIEKILKLNTLKDYLDIYQINLEPLYLSAYSYRKITTKYKTLVEIKRIVKSILECIYADTLFDKSKLNTNMEDYELYLTDFITDKTQNYGSVNISIIEFLESIIELDALLAIEEYGINGVHDYNVLIAKSILKDVNSIYFQLLNISGEIHDEQISKGRG